jgi:WD40 repeat protein
VSRIFLSHSSSNNRDAIALKQWLSEQRPELANEIFLDIDPDTGLPLGLEWKDQLFLSNSLCEYLICLLSKDWVRSSECKLEFRIARGFRKRILCARLENLTDDHWRDAGHQEGNFTRELQRCDLFADGPKTEIAVPGGPPVRFNTAALYQIRRVIEGTGIRPENFVWPPSDEPGRAPYRGWEPFEDIDAGVFFGRDAAIAAGLKQLRDMRVHSPTLLADPKSLFAVVAPSGSGKSSFLRAGLIPRLQRDDRRFLVLGVVRPGSSALTGDFGFAAAIDTARGALKMSGTPLGDIKKICRDNDAERLVTLFRDLLVQVRGAAASRLDDTVASSSPGAERSDDERDAPPTLVLPVDQAEELFYSDAGPEAEQFLTLIAELVSELNTSDVGLIVAASIRTDRYDRWQSHPALTGIGTALFNELKPMPRSEYKEVITGPVARASEAGQRLTITPDLVTQLINDASEGADTLPLLALTLDRLYRDYGKSIGGMRELVNNEIEEMLRRDRHDRTTAVALLRSAFIPWLVRFNPDNNRPMRRVARESKLPDTEGLIDALVEKRMLVRDERNGHAVVEVALESLLTEWTELAAWLDEERENVKTVDDIIRSANAWEGHHRDPAWLELSGTRLDEAEKLAEQPSFGSQLADASDYLTACRKATDAIAAEEKRHRRRTRRILVSTALVVVVALIALVATIQAVNARNRAQQNARQATAARVSADALDMLNRYRAGGDLRAIQEMLAGAAISPATTGDDGVAATQQLSWASKVFSPGLTTTAAYSVDGRRVASGGFDHTVRIWDASTGAEIGKPLLGHHGRITGMAFSPDGNRLVSASDDGELRLWDADNGEQITCRTTAGSACPANPDPSRDYPGVLSLAYSRDGKHLATGDTDDDVQLWDPQTLQPIRRLQGHADAVYSVAFDPSGPLLASGSRDATIRLWNSDTGASVGEPLRGQSKTILSVAFSPDGHRLASGSDDTSIWIWDEVDTGHPVGRMLTDKDHPGAVHTAPVNAVTFSAKGGTLLSGSEDGTIRWWDASTGFSNQLRPPRQADPVQTVAFLANAHGAYGMVFSTVGGLQLWNTLRLAIPFDGHQDTVTVVAFDPKHPGVIASGSKDHHVLVWDPRSDRELVHEMQAGDGVGWLAFSPDGTRIVSASWDGKLCIWDAATGKPAGPGVIDTHGLSLASVAYSPDGQRIVSAGSDDKAQNWSLQMWDAHTGAPTGPAMAGQGPPLETVAFSPNGSLIAAAGDDYTIRLWDARTGQPKGQLSGHTDSVYSLAFNPDGHQIVSGSWDSTVRIWDVEHLTQIGQPLTGHAGKVRVAAFSPDGRYVASAGDDGTVRLWNAQTGNPVGAPLSAGSDPIWAVAFSPDGNELVSAGEDTELHLWPFTQDAQNALCGRITTNMSHKQWRDWISKDIDYQTQCPALPIAPDE